MSTSSLFTPGIPLVGTRQRHLSIALLLGGLMLTFLVAQLWRVSRTLDGVDSANFALAVDRYDPRLHQPHPPGYPVHVALARVVRATYRSVVVPPKGVGSTLASLRILSALCGSLAVFVLLWLAVELGMAAWRATLVAALTATCPLFWVTAMRPLSDASGLLFALLSQSLALSAFNQTVDGARATPGNTSDSVPFRWIASGAIAGLALGVRVQTGLLTLPLLAVLLTLRTRNGSFSPIRQTLTAFAGGALAWVVPTTIAVGGPAEYLRLLLAVAADDVQGVEMLATHPTPRLLVTAFSSTVVVPWGHPALGWIAAALIAFGMAALARYHRRTLGFVAVMIVPYLVFHLLFQETASIRYALPFVPLMSILIVSSTKRRQVGWFVALVVLMIAAAGTVSARATAAYRRGGPVSHALSDIGREAAIREHAPTLAAHHSVGRAIRASRWPGRVLASPVGYEWQELAKHWLSGDRDPIWFLADSRRTDLALIDPASRTRLHAYEWPPDARMLMGGSNPSRVDWYQITAPGWFLMEGWALTPETRGVAVRDHQGPGFGGIIGYIRRRNAPAVMMIGGRNLGGPCDTPASIDVLVDGRRRAGWTTSTRTPFLQTISFAAGELTGDGEFAVVRVVARDTTPADRLVDVSVEHFDIQSPGSAVAGFDDGWHMPELDPVNGVTWRWMGQVAELRIESFGRDVDLMLRGESPLRYFGEPPRVVVKAAAARLAEFHPAADFEWTVPVSAADLTQAGGRITVETDRFFVPDDVRGTGDRRRLALRIYEVRVRPRLTAPRTP